MPGGIAITSSTPSTATSRTTSSFASRSRAICCPPIRRGNGDEQLVATGFLALGVKDVNQRFKVRFIMDNVDEQIDAVTRSFLALTASCARCHDHKFDPVPTTDYYALAGIFRSSDLCAGLRNKMGGGGLDYYDSQLLIPLGDQQTAADLPKRSRWRRKSWRPPPPSSRRSATIPRGTSRPPTADPSEWSRGSKPKSRGAICCC